jgi:hypothetical protein
MKHAAGIMVAVAVVGLGLGAYVSMRRGAAPGAPAQPQAEGPRRASPAVLVDRPLHGIAEQAAANRRSVVEARETGRFPERLSPLVRPKPFDLQAYAADPQAYLDVVEPGRVWQTSDGASGVEALRAAGVAYMVVPPGGSVMLEVDAVPFAPVTFTSLDMGAFDNGLTSITVRADAGGRARVTFTAVAGTIDRVNILAGSPLTVGQARFAVRVKED